ncbi:MAG: hydantoinase B/oxoprolinase family protein [Candidatus Heimdallarchaeota archaeon]
MQTINPAFLQVYGNALLSISEQMGIILVKTAYSTNIKERRDASVAVFDTQGKLLALAQHIPLHFSSLFSSVEEIMDKWAIDEIHEGDVFIANDPYSGGGSHLADIVFVNPVFYQGKLIAFVANLGHHADKSHRGTTIYDEGLRIPAVKLYDKGELMRDIYDLILLNYQLTKERQGDFRAQLSTNRFGELKLQELCDKIGLDQFLYLANNWQEYGARAVKHAISQLPKGDYEFEDFLDDDGYGNEAIPIKLKVTVKDEDLIFDFTGSASQVDGPFNCVKSALLATVFYCVKAFLDPTLPSNSGMFDSITVRAPLGSIVNAVAPAATNDRETTCQRIADTVLGAFAKIDPERVVAAGNGAVSFFTFSGVNAETKEPYVYIETIGGGSGARSTKDGLDAVQVHMTNTSNLPVEALEMDYPLLVERYEMVQDSGGAGKYRGGLAIRRTIRILEKSQNTVLIAAIERAKFKPWGLFGGKAGSNAKLSVLRKGKIVNNSSKISLYPLEPEDIVDLVTPGAGGYGDPACRDPVLIEKDLREEKISKKAARQDYNFFKT